jgi:hypothetical protein
VKLKAAAGWRMRLNCHIDCDIELPLGFFDAVLRDYARLARLLAHDGTLGGKQKKLGAGEGGWIANNGKPHLRFAKSVECRKEIGAP